MSKVVPPPMPQDTGIGPYCHPANCGKPAPRTWLLKFEDIDRPGPIFLGEDEARKAFAHSEAMGWNCHLFVSAERATPATPVEGASDARLDGIEAWLRKEGGHADVEWPSDGPDDLAGGSYRHAADAINNLRVVNRLSDRMIADLRATVSQQAAEMERLERTVDRLSAYNENETVSNVVHNAVVARIATLESALAACRGDAARYRWLRANMSNGDPPIGLRIRHPDGRRYTFFDEALLDKAIDSALASKESAVETGVDPWLQTR